MCFLVRPHIFCVCFLSTSDSTCTIMHDGTPCWRRYSVGFQSLYLRQKKRGDVYKFTSLSRGLVYENKADRLKHCNLNSVSQRWKHTGLCTEAGEWKHSGNSPVITIRWLSLCLALRGHVWWPPVIVYGGSLNSASQGWNASLLQWALKMPLLPQYSLVPLLSADGPPPDAGYTHYGVLDGSIWCWEETWGFDQMSSWHVLHSLTFISQNLFSTLDCSWYDLTAVALISPACYLDTNGHGWYFTSILSQSHPASPDTSESLSVDNYQSRTWFFFPHSHV